MCSSLPESISYIDGAIVMLDSLQPVTEYRIRIRGEYPNSREVLFSDNRTFTTTSKY